tara:strand:- start:42 stop:476 length:435 start_codon:yes stop_codon:yes gene_type:complete
MSIKKAKFSAASLPGINSDTEGYLLRYRIVSEDKNRVSAWSPVLKLEPSYVYGIGLAAKSDSGSIITASWDAVSIIIDGDPVRSVNNYDIWVSWNSGASYEFYGSTSNTYANILKPAGIASGSIRIYHKTNPPIEIPKFKLYDI